MDGREFWLNLEFRVSRELQGMRENHLRFLGCDGFEPTGVENDSRGTWIVGRAHIMGGDLGAAIYAFRLRIGEAGVEPAVDDWSILLPSEHATGWLYVDRPERFLEIRPPHRTA